MSGDFGFTLGVCAVMVFRDAPGDVVRCANCQSVILVAVPVPTGIRVSFQSLRWIEISGE